jgi:hypothetical protein
LIKFGLVSSLVSVRMTLPYQTGNKTTLDLLIHVDDILTETLEKNFASIV